MVDNYTAIRPYKGRRIDARKPVEVYRNLRRRGYSIRQSGLVVGHASQLSLTDCSFVVQKAGQRRCRKTRRRNVHAWVQGMLDTRKRKRKCPLKITYRPYRDAGFMCRKFGCPAFRVSIAFNIQLNSTGVTADYAY